MKKLSYILIILICFGIFLFPFSEVSAQSPLKLGGLTVWSFFCTCSYNFLIYIPPLVTPNGTVPNGFFSYFFTPQFANYKLPSVGGWALGLYAPGGVCMIVVPTTPPSCVSFIPPQGSFTTMIGTSLGV